MFEKRTIARRKALVPLQQDHEVGNRDCTTNWNALLLNRQLHELWDARDICHHINSRRRINPAWRIPPHHPDRPTLMLCGLQKCIELIQRDSSYPLQPISWDHQPCIWELPPFHPFATKLFHVSFFVTSGCTLLTTFIAHSLVVAIGKCLKPIQNWSISCAPKTPWKPEEHEFASIPSNPPHPLPRNTTWWRTLLRVSILCVLLLRAGKWKKTKKKQNSH